MKKKLKSLVRREAKSLRKYATTIERNKLKFFRLDHSSTESCIYGQLTGNCFSNRASELITKCTVIVFESGISLGSFFDMKQQVKTSKCTTIFDGFGRDAFSPIEKFIALSENQDNGNNERLVDYLKGNTNTLILK